MWLVKTIIIKWNNFRIPDRIKLKLRYHHILVKCYIFNYIAGVATSKEINASNVHIDSWGQEVATFNISFKLEEIIIY